MSYPLATREEVCLSSILRQEPERPAAQRPNRFEVRDVIEIFSKAPVGTRVYGLPQFSCPSIAVDGATTLTNSVRRGVVTRS